MTNVKENKQIDYSRLKLLMSKINEFTETLPEDMSKENGFELLIIAHDVKNGATASYTILDNEDERESLIQCIDKSISVPAMKGADKNPIQWNILNSMAEYLMRLSAMFPELYESFKNGVEHFKSANNESN